MKHNSMRGWFAYELYKQMKKNENIYVLTGDLGFGMLDYIKRDFPKKFINVGAAEHSMINIAVGLSLESKIVFVYSITTFLIYRAFESVRNYLNYENISVKLIGGGRDNDYEKLGFTHCCPDIKLFLNNFEKIIQFWPYNKKEIPQILSKMINNNKPCFLSLIR